MKNVTFFLSTGRCGTQWIAELLKKGYPEVHVEHEALLSRYRSGQYTDNPLDIIELESVQNHLKNIKEITKEKNYIEVGWPCYSALPLFIEELNNVKIVHIIRNPLDCALSHVSHFIFRSDLRVDEYTEFCLPPTKEKDPFHKALSTWLFVNKYWKNYITVNYPDVPIKTFKSEDLFNGEIKDLLKFIGLPYKEGIEKTEKVDGSSFHLYDVKWEEIFERKDVLDVAEGYDYKIHKEIPKKLNKKPSGRTVFGIPCTNNINYKFGVNISNACLYLVEKGYSIDVIYKEGSLIPKQRNFIAQKCLWRGDDLLFIDSDILFDPEEINKLIQSDKDIIGGIYKARRKPYKMEVYYCKEDDEENLINYRIEDIPKENFICDGIGAGFFYIKHRVLKKMYSYDFVMKYGHPFSMYNLKNGSQLGEDLSFCLRAKKAGFDVWCNPDVNLGHIFESVIWTWEKEDA